MPPVAQPGSRAGLITTLVIFVILFLVAAIFAVSYRLDLEKAQTGEESYRKSLAKLASPEKQEDYGRLSEGERTAVDVLEDRIRTMGALIDPATASDVQKTIGARDAAIKAAAARVQAAGVTLDATTTLPNAVKFLADRVAALNDRAVKAEAERAAALAQRDDATTKHVADIKKKDEEIAAATGRVSEALKKLEETYKPADAKYLASQQLAEKTIGELKEALNAANTATQQKEQDRAAAQKTADEYKKRLAFNRFDVKVAPLRQPDGVLTRVSSSEKAWINLGQGDQMSPGMTFEVYDANEGIPNVLAKADDQLPIGKASVEVINVGAGQSEVQIVRKNPGATLVPGDIIVNIVYDKNVKLSFAVLAGDGFDLNQDGRTNPADADLIKRLITTWGASATDGPSAVTVNTDFLVLGKEPILPKLPDNPNADEQYRLDQAKKKLEAYDTVRQKAIDLHIPILNQNRFLYYVGYYDLARRGQ